MFVQCLLFLTIFGSLNADRFRMSYQPRPCLIPRIDHGRVRVRRSTLIKFMCLPRYELVGNRYATCKDGQWDTPIPVCVRGGCTVPHIENGIGAASRNNAWVMYFCMPEFKLVGSSAIYCDGRRWNATAPTCVNASAIQNSLSCDFENSLCGWTQDELHDFDWKRLNTRTPSSFLNTGPSADHTYGPGGTVSGYYMYIESTSRFENDTARFVSPIYDRALAEDGCFSFFYHMFGRTCGGLRVYQKPDNLPLESLVQSSEVTKKEYILFEKWGNLGDVWYNSVSPLRQFNDNFQIIIEGIRGTSYTSDIAIDDVAILQGLNCSAAIHSASTPPPSPVMPDSCVDRCRTMDSSVPSADPTLGCGCSGLCMLHGNCCPDFFDTCIFVPDTTIPEDMLPANSSDGNSAPVTQKLVASTPETTSSSTTTTTTSTTTTTTTPRPTTTTTTTKRPTTTTSTTTTTTTTHRPTTTSTTTTTPRPTTTSTTTTTTQRPTTKRPTTTTQSTLKTNPPTITTSKIINTPTTKAPAVTTKIVNTTRQPTTTVRKLTTVATKSTTEMPYGISRTIENHNVYHELVEKKRKEHTVETRKLSHTSENGAEQKSSNGWKIALIVLGVVLCVGLVLAVRLRGSTRAWVEFAGLRGRLTNDPEVRYLSADPDDF